MTPNIRLTILITTAFSILLSLTSLAVDTNWIGGDAGGVSDWTIAANWSAGVPGAADKAVIDPTKSAYVAGVNDPVIDMAAATVNEIKVDHGGILFIQAGGSITVDEKDVNVQNNSILNMSGGTLIIGTVMEKSLKAKKGGIINITGGTIDIYKDLNAEEGGTININEDDAAVTIIVDFDTDGMGKLKIKSKNNRDALLNMDAGTMTIGTQGIEMDGNGDAGSSVATLDMSGGTLTNNGITKIKKSDSDSTKIILTGGTLTLSGDVADDAGSEGTIDINVSGGTLTFGADLTMEAEDLMTESGTGTIRFTNVDMWTNDGTFSSSGGTVIFVGTTTVLGTGSFQFHELEITGSMDQSGPCNLNQMDANFSSQVTFPRFSVGSHDG